MTNPPLLGIRVTLLCRFLITPKRFWGADGRAGLHRLRKNSFYGPKIELIRMYSNLESMTCEHGNWSFGLLEGVFPQPVQPRRNRGSCHQFLPRPAQLAAGSCAGRGTEVQSARPCNGGAEQAAEKPFSAVILSAAKDLHWFVSKEILPMLRCAQHDRRPFSAACKAPPFQARVDKFGVRVNRTA